MPKENMSGCAMGYALLLLLYLSNSAKSIPQKTLVVYSGPTSLNRHEAKNGMYHDNMMYFLEYGMSCSDDDPGSNSDSNAESVIVNYAFVLTQEVADYYTGTNGPMAKKIQECEGGDKDNREYDTNIPFIRVMTRQDRCYDMESIWMVANANVLNLYDNVVFINCGMVGPKLGPGSPRHIHSSSTMEENEGRAMVPYSHWSQLYTSGLTDSIRLVGHSINTHFNTFSPHIQSFLYAMRTDTVPMLLSSGAIYDCGLTQEQLGSNPEKRFDLIKRYEVGMSTQLLARGYKIATAFINQYEFGTSLAYGDGDKLGMELDYTISDIWFEDGIRNLTATMPRSNPKFWQTEKQKSLFLRGYASPGEDTFEHHQWDILPWDYFVFFKVSRFVPGDVQREMNYNTDEMETAGVSVVPNDPRKSHSEYWLRKSGIYTPRQALIDVCRISGICFVVGLFAARRWLHFVVRSRLSYLLRRKTPYTNKLG
mmetsp:Transcript_29229/g.70503  ORF Transcript_29229/g.70503 Transcript_29229/m.70503 type:complete len:480 (+) Transcript_29229:277-1716(+)